MTSVAYFMSWVPSRCFWRDMSILHLARNAESDVPYCILCSNPSRFCLLSPFSSPLELFSRAKLHEVNTTPAFMILAVMPKVATTMQCTLPVNYAAWCCLSECSQSVVEDLEMLEILENSCE